MKRKSLLLIGVFLAIAVIAPLCILVALPYFLFGGGSFEYSGSRITPDVRKLCPAYVTIEGAKVLHIKNTEGMTGGQMTVAFELPPDRLPTFLAGSPLKDAVFESKFVPNEFLGPNWLTRQRFDELQSNKLFSAASISEGRTHYSILIDRTRSDIYVIYLQSTS